MAKITSSDALDLIVLSKASAPIGAVIHSTLSEVQFAAENLGTWALMDGRSCAGSAYATLTGSSTVPDATTGGTFLRQAKSGRAIGSFEDEDFKSHTHVQNAHTHIQDAHSHVTPRGWETNSGGTSASYTSSSSTANAWSNSTNTAVATNQNATATNQNTGGTETRPKNLAVNMFIKIGY